MRRAGVTLLEMIVVLVILVAIAALVVPLVDGTVQQSRDGVTRGSLVQLREVLLNRYGADMSAEMDGYPRPNPAPPDRVQHPQLHFLFVKPNNAPPYDPIARRGWNGPYVQHTGARLDLATLKFRGMAGAELQAERRKYGVGPDELNRNITPDATVLDAWGVPIILQVPTDPTPGLTDNDRSKHARLISAGADGIFDTPAIPFYPSVAQCGDDIVLYLRVPDLRP